MATRNIIRRPARVGDRNFGRPQSEDRLRSVPDSDREHLFLPDAIDRVGRALFKDAWLGPSTTVAKFENLPPIDKRATATQRQVDRAATLIEENRPELWKASDHVSWADYDMFTIELQMEDGSSIVEDASWSEGLWQAALDLHHREVNLQSLRLEQVAHVRDVLLDRLRSNELRSWIRRREGGEFEKMSCSLWNSENLVYRFEEGMIDRRRPFSDHIDANLTHWIFVSPSDLNRIDGYLPELALTPEWQATLSVYMVLGLRLAHKLRMTPDRQPSVTDLTAAIKAEWAIQYPERDKISHEMAGRLATVMRTPEAQRGSAGGGRPAKSPGRKDKAGS